MKKGISPVVSIALLLVVTVISIISFQTWYESYQSNLFSTMSSSSSIDNFESRVQGIFNDQLYVNGGEGILITRVEIDGYECSLATGEVTGLEGLDISDCISQISTDTLKVLIFTEDNVISESIYIKNSYDEEITCSVNAQGFAGGDGTLSNPYQVCNCVQLDNIRNYLSSSFELTNNINCGITPYNQGVGFEPISNFLGNLSGKSYSINNLYINNISRNFVGLFSSLQADGVYVTIENINFNNVNISGRDYVGTLVGYVGTVGSNRMTFTNISSSGSILGRNEIGGIGGNFYQEILLNAAFDGIVTSYGNQRIGGVVGYISGSTLSNVRANVSINAPNADYVGGLSGHDGFFGTIENSYSEGSVIGRDYVGGISGRIRNMYNSFSVSNVSATQENVSSLSVIFHDSGTTSNNFWNNVSGNPNNAYLYNSGSPDITEISDNLSYFYDSSNPPFNNTWNQSIWFFSGNDLPSLRFE